MSRLKELFDRRFPSPCKVYMPLIFDVQTTIAGRSRWEEQTLREHVWITIHNVHINRNKTTIAFNVEISNFELLKEWYTDDRYRLKSGHLSIGIHEAFKDVLRFLNHPSVRVHIVNNHPLIQKLT